MSNRKIVSVLVLSLLFVGGLCSEKCFAQYWFYPFSYPQRQASVPEPPKPTPDVEVASPEKTEDKEEVIPDGVSSVAEETTDNTKQETSQTTDEGIATPEQKEEPKQTNTGGCPNGQCPVQNQRGYSYGAGYRYGYGYGYGYYPFYW